MNAVLDFPAIHAEPPAVEKTNAIAAGIASVQGEVAKFDQIAAGLAAIEAAHPKNVIVAAIDTPPGMQAAQHAWRSYRNPRLEVERARKAAKAPVLALGKAIDTFAGGLEDRLRAGEDHYKAQIDAEEARRAAIKAEQERLEREAAERHAARRSAIAMYALRCQEPGMTAERISAGMQRLDAADLSDPDPARAAELAELRTKTLEAMRTLHAQAVAREQEAARQEAIRLENERVAAELAAERARIAEEAAAIRRQAEELEAREAAARAAHQAQVDANAAADLRRAAELQAEFEANCREATAREQAAQDTERREGQQVLKAEGASPDATDRSIPATTSPCVGTMGAGQAADAAPAVGLMLQDECRDLSIALATKPDAMQHAREAAEAIAREAQIHAAGTQAMQAEAQLIDRSAPPVTIITHCAPDVAERVLQSPLKLAAELDATHDLLRESLALADHLALAFASKYPTQPKMGVEWWAEARQGLEALRPKLLEAVAGRP